MDLDSKIKSLKQQLKSQSDPKRAAGEKKYLKSPLKHYGVTLPQIHTIAKDWLKTNNHASINEITGVAKKLWNSPWHEERMLAVSILELNKEKLTSKQLPFIEYMITTATGWALLDGIAVWLVGALIDADKNTLKYLPAWIKSKNFWIRRAAILAQILQFRRGEGDFKLFEQLASTQLEVKIGKNKAENWEKMGKIITKDERFFIRKAIGWALRELAPHRPQLVYNFVKKYRPQISGLTFREATRKLPLKLQKQLKN